MTNKSIMTTPAPEGEVVAWLRPRTTAVISNDEKLNALCGGDEGRASFLSQYTQPLYASPVVPVSREEIVAILESHIGAAAWSGDAEVHGIPEAADAILAAIGTKATDTGREG